MIDAARALLASVAVAEDAASDLADHVVRQIERLEALRSAIVDFIQQPATGEGVPDATPEPVEPPAGRASAESSVGPAGGSYPCLEPGCPRTFGSAHALRIHRARGHREPSERSDNARSREKRRQQREADAARAAAAESALAREEAGENTIRPLADKSSWLCGRCPGKFSTEELRQVHYDATGHGSTEPMPTPVAGVARSPMASVLHPGAGGGRIGDRRRDTGLGQ